MLMTHLHCLNAGHKFDLNIVKDPELTLGPRQG